MVIYGCCCYVGDFWKFGDGFYLGGLMMVVMIVVYGGVVGDFL